MNFTQNSATSKAAGEGLRASLPRLRLLMLRYFSVLSVKLILQQEGRISSTGWLCATVNHVRKDPPDGNHGRFHSETQAVSAPRSPEGYDLVLDHACGDRVYGSSGADVMLASVLRSGGTAGP